MRRQSEAALSSPPPQGVLRDEDGMLSILSVLSGLFLAVLAAAVANIGVAINQKVEMQDAADAVASAVTIQRARTLNSVTAANHVGGELMALVVLHESLGADPNYPEADTAGQDGALTDLSILHDALKNESGLPTVKPALGDVSQGDAKQKVKVKYALLDSYKELKQLTIDIYEVKTTGELLASLRQLPYVGPVFYAIGAALYAAATAIEVMVEAEWMALKAIETAGSATAGLRDQIYSTIPQIRKFASDTLDQMPSILTQTTEAMAKKHGVQATIFPDRPSLNLSPETVEADVDVAAVKKDPKAVNRKRSVFAKSQIVRASYPWVNYHRQPVMKWTKWMVLSQFGMHYLEWSKAFALVRPAEYYNENGSAHRMHVIDGLNPLRKGFEAWTRDARAADSNFCTIGFAYRPSPGRSPAFFPRSNPSGTVTYAQAMMYNANAQHAGDRYPLQPEVGWDTLNWISPASKAHAPEWPAFSLSSPSPQVRLNWQAKLVPTSRLPEAVGEVKSPFSSVLGRLDPRSPLASAH